MSNINEFVAQKVVEYLESNEILELRKEINMWRIAARCDGCNCSFYQQMPYQQMTLLLHPCQCADCDTVECIDCSFIQQKDGDNVYVCSSCIYDYR